MRKSIKALLATGMILLPLTACNSTMEAMETKEETSYPIAYALSKNHTYTLTDYDFLSVSTSTFHNANDDVFKFTITENLYIVENISTKKYDRDIYMWYFSKDVPWYIISYYNKNTEVIIK